MRPVLSNWLHFGFIRQYCCNQQQKFNGSGFFSWNLFYIYIFFAKWRLNLLLWKCVNLKPPVSNEGRLFLASNKLFSATLLMHFGARKSPKNKFRWKNQKLQKLGENSRNREEMENRSRKKLGKWVFRPRWLPCIRERCIVKTSYAKQCQ